MRSNTADKVEAWRVAGNLVQEYAQDLLARCDDSRRDAKARVLGEHLRDSVAPSLYRRAEIIERRKRVGNG
jgi:hypothetical protein